MQKDLFQPDEEIGWEVEFMVILSEEPLPTKDLNWLPIYIHTKPKNWKTPEPSDIPPWESSP